MDLGCIVGVGNMMLAPLALILFVLAFGGLLIPPVLAPSHLTGGSVGAVDRPAEVVIEPAPVQSGHGFLKIDHKQSMSSRIVRIEPGIIGSGGNAFVVDQVQHVSVFLPAVIVRLGKEHLTAGADHRRVVIPDLISVGP